MWLDGLAKHLRFLVRIRSFSPGTATFSTIMAKKSAILLLANGAEEMEAVITVDVLRRAGIVVTVASVTSDDVIECSREVRILADAKLAYAVKDAKYDVVVLPGGLGGAKALASSACVGELLKEQEARGAAIAAICAAPTALKAHGIGKGKCATGYPALKDKIDDFYSYVDEKVAIDGNLITSKGPATAFAFGLAIVEKLSGKEAAVSVAKGLLYEGYD